MGLQIRNGLVGPVGIFDLVQLGLREGVVEVLDGHLVEGDHVVEFIQLIANTKEQKEKRGKKTYGYKYRFPEEVHELF